MYPSTALTAEQHADLYARARRQAQLLRRAAVIDFWRGVYGLGARTLSAARRLLRSTSTSNSTSTVATARVSTTRINPVSRNPSGA